jgi:hypothetical protein
MRVFLIGLGSALLALAGCATQEPVVSALTAPVIVANANTDLSPKTKMVCHKESSIGSNMIHSVCEAEQSDADRLASQDRLRNTMLNNNVAHPAVGSP